MFLAALLLFSSWAPAQAAPPIPPAPTNYVLDEPHVLSPGAVRSIESLLIEQDHLTGQQILVAIFNTLGDEDLNERTNLIFQDWKIGQRGENNGVLLAVYWKEHKSRIEVGYGLEGTLTDAKSKDILEDQLVPAMRDGDPDRAISLSVIEILKVLQSPLIENGRARQIVQKHEGRAVERWAAPPSSHGGYWVWLVVGLIALVIVFNTLTSADAHFTSGGWYRPKPWRRRWGRDGNWPGGGGFWGGFGGGGGGGFGGWGDSGGGGGFSGGGGSSGGGGASAGW